jgi:CheY-like chemotaxis protein
VIVRVEVPHALALGSESALWFGLAGGAHPGFVATAEVVGRDVSEWLMWYGGILEATTRMAADRKRLTQRIEEMNSVIHDARAPLGVLRHMTQEIGAAGQVSALRHELEYLEEVLSQGAPQSDRGARLDLCDVGDVLRRVHRRFASERSDGALTIEVGYGPLHGRCSALELERIVTNLVSNAQRHAPHAQTRIEAEERAGEIVISVRDNGPGIPASTLNALRDGRTVESGCASGWGIGLQSCIAKAKMLGGRLAISSGEGAGTCVSVLMPIGEAPLSSQLLEVADGAVQREAIDVYVVDDDREHGASLSRVLRSFGLSVRQSESLEGFLGDFKDSRVSSILCDAHMPDGGAERLLPILAMRSNAPRLAIISGDSSDDYLYRLAALGAQAFFTKPVNVDEVVAWIRGESFRISGGSVS